MVEVSCNFCSKKFGSEVSLEQHIHAKHSQQSKQAQQLSLPRKKSKKYVILTFLALIVLLLSYMVYSYNTKPGKYDDFAKCLTAKGAVIYGNDFCQYTAKQLNFFGKSEKYLNYIKCIENKQLCDSKEVKVTPTWEINSTMYEQVQTFEKLALLSGCALK